MPMPPAPHDPRRSGPGTWPATDVADAGPRPAPTAARRWKRPPTFARARRDRRGLGALGERPRSPVPRGTNDDFASADTSCRHSSHRGHVTPRPKRACGPASTNRPNHPQYGRLVETGQDPSRRGVTLGYSGPSEGRAFPPLFLIFVPVCCAGTGPTYAWDPRWKRRLAAIAGPGARPRGRSWPSPPDAYLPYLAVRMGRGRRFSRS